MKYIVSVLFAFAVSSILEYFNFSQFMNGWISCSIYILIVELYEKYKQNTKE